MNAASIPHCWFDLHPVKVITAALPALLSMNWLVTLLRLWLLTIVEGGLYTRTRLDRQCLNPSILPIVVRDGPCTTITRTTLSQAAIMSSLSWMYSGGALAALLSMNCLATLLRLGPLTIVEARLYIRTRPDRQCLNPSILLIVVRDGPCTTWLQATIMSSL